MEACLNGMDVELIVFSEVGKAIEYLKGNKPDMLFLSTKMPGRDGLSFLRELRHQNLQEDTPVVMLSSKDYTQDQVVAKELGVKKFLIKPMPKKSIIAAVNECLERDR